MSHSFCDFFKPGESRKPTVNIIATVESAECSVLPQCWNYKKSDLFSLKLSDKVYNNKLIQQDHLALVIKGTLIPIANNRCQNFSLEQ